MAGARGSLAARRRTAVTDSPLVATLLHECPPANSWGFPKCLSSFLKCMVIFCFVLFSQWKHLHMKKIKKPCENDLLWVRNIFWCALDWFFSLGIRCDSPSDLQGFGLCLYVEIVGVFRGLLSKCLCKCLLNPPGHNFLEGNLPASPSFQPPPHPQLPFFCSFS